MTTIYEQDEHLLDDDEHPYRGFNISKTGTLARPYVIEVWSDWGNECVELPVAEAELWNLYAALTNYLEGEGK